MPKMQRSDSATRRLLAIRSRRICVAAANTWATRPECCPLLDTRTGLQPWPCSIPACCIVCPPGHIDAESSREVVRYHEERPAPSQDFTGFRVVTLLPRFRPSWPPPGAYEQPAPRKFKCAARLSAPRSLPAYAMRARSGRC